MVQRLSCGLAVLALTWATSVQGQEAAGEAFFHWRVVPGTRRCELFAAGHKIGLWDDDRRHYFRVATDGQLVGPVQPPFPIRSHDEAESTRNERPRVPPQPERSWLDDLPPWIAYAIGGVVTVLIAGVGVAMQGRNGRSGKARSS